MKFLALLLVLFILASCSLSAKQEQELSKQTGIYLNSIKTNSILLFVSKTHPTFVKYAKEKGNEFFKHSFSTDLEQLEFVDLTVLKIKSEKNSIHVLYQAEKDYIFKGENKKTPYKFVAISDDKGKSWYYLGYNIYSNKNICKEITRLIK